MNITFDDTKFIRDHEGCSLSAYPDPATHGEPYTIAYGLTGSWVTPDLQMTQEEADSRFMAKIHDFCTRLDSYITVPVNKNQYLALLSLMWNIGPANVQHSTLIEKLNAGDTLAAAVEFNKWVHAAGKVMLGLVTRRHAEMKLFLTPVST